MSDQQNPQYLDQPCGSRNYSTTNATFNTEEYSMHRSHALTPTYPNMIIHGGNSPLYSPQYSSKDAQLDINIKDPYVDRRNIYVMDQAMGHVSPIQPPRSAEPMFEGYANTSFGYTRQAPIGHTTLPYTSTTPFVDDTLFENCNNYSSISQFSGSEATETDYGNDMGSMHLNATPRKRRVRVKTSNLANVQNEQGKRGRPQEGHSVLGASQDSKNEYMRYYNQIKKVKQDIGPLADQIFANLHDQLLSCPTNGPIYREILSLKDSLVELEKKKNNRDKSKNSLP